jgi:hypothetical protein
MNADKKHDGPGYEVRDAHAGATYRAGLYILGTMFLVAAVLVPAYRLLVRQEARTQKPPASLVGETAAPAEASFPKLVVSEPAALAEHRRGEEELLKGWGWVEKDRGIARMPIDEAVRIVGERGALPAFPAPAPAAEPAAPLPGGGR